MASPNQNTQPMQMVSPQQNTPTEQMASPNQNQNTQPMRMASPQQNTHSTQMAFPHQNAQTTQVASPYYVPYPAVANDKLSRNHAHPTAYYVFDLLFKLVIGAALVGILIVLTQGLRKIVYWLARMEYELDGIGDEL